MIYRVKGFWQIYKYTNCMLIPFNSISNLFYKFNYSNVKWFGMKSKLLLLQQIILLIIIIRTPIKNQPFKYIFEKLGKATKKKKKKKTITGSGSHLKIWDTNTSSGLWH